MIPKRKLYFQLNPMGGKGQHFGGVNKVLSSYSGDTLFSGGRDGTIKCWQINEEEAPTLKFSSHAHTDWVNDMALIEQEGPSGTTEPYLLISASNDCQIRLWHLNSDSTAAEPVQTIFDQHQDYIKCVSADPTTHLVASAGLDHSILIWDISAPGGPKVQSKLSTQCGNSYSVPSASLAGKFVLDCSVYSLSLGAAGATAVAAGGRDRAVTVLDARAAGGGGGGGAPLRLEGHTGHVRAVRFLGENGGGGGGGGAPPRRLLSASSDGSVALWDLRAAGGGAGRACVASWAPLTGGASVWSLEPVVVHAAAAAGGGGGGGGEGFFAGGASGEVRYVDLGAPQVAAAAAGPWGGLRPTTPLGSPAPTDGRVVCPPCGSAALSLAPGGGRGGGGGGAGGGGGGGGDLWVAGGRGELARWGTAAAVSGGGGGGGGGRGGGPAYLGRPRPGAPGRPALAAHRRLPNQIYLLAEGEPPAPAAAAAENTGRKHSTRASNTNRGKTTEDEAKKHGAVSMWDIKSGREIHSWPAGAGGEGEGGGSGGGGGLAARAAALADRSWARPWFDVRRGRGAPVVELDPARAFDGEAYVTDLGLDLGPKETAESAKVNLGVLMVRGLLRRWYQRRYRLLAQKYGQDIGSPDRRRMKRGGSEDENSSCDELDGASSWGGGGGGRLPPFGPEGDPRAFAVPDDTLVWVTETRVHATETRAHAGNDAVRPRPGRQDEGARTKQCCATFSGSPR